MTVSAIVTTCNYARFLPTCLDSALEFCDEVLVYDDGSTDETLEVLARYPEVKLTRREEPSGSPVWGSNLGIEEATSTHLIFLDADNWLIAPPPITDADYCAATLLISDGTAIIDRWDYSDWFPMTAEQSIERFRATHQMPYPWGGVWRTSFVKPLRWREWKSTQFAADFRTAVDWARCFPELDYSPTPFLVFRVHPAQWSARSDERAKMMEEVEAICRECG